MARNMLGKKVLTGMRTTGPLHLGHKVGALDNWVKVQNSGKHECFFLLADNQALTTEASDLSFNLERAIELCIYDWISVGIDPSLSNVHIVLQSAVEGRDTLFQRFAAIADFKKVLANPTIKAEMARQKFISLSFVCYSIDQIGDIQIPDPMMGGAGGILVPVGKDQLPHLEGARDLVRKMNRDYMSKMRNPVYLTPCEGLVGDIGRLVGTDGKSKMSKSIGNTVGLTDTAEEVARKIKGMKSGTNDDTRFDQDDEEGVYTLYGHPTFLRLSEEGLIDGVQFDDMKHLKTNPVIEYAMAFLSPEDTIDLLIQYRDGVIRYGDVKHQLTEVINLQLDPIRARRSEVENIDIWEIIADGTKVASENCKLVVERVNEAMGIRSLT